MNIDGAGRKNLARYVNHSCRPNCFYKHFKGRVWYVAKRRIEPGEELTGDYGAEYFTYWIAKRGCRCGATKHRKLLVEKKKKKKSPR